MISQTSLVVKKETKFDRIRKNLFLLFFKEEYYLMERIDHFMAPKKINTSKIIIPKEIKINQKK